MGITSSSSSGSEVDGSAGFSWKPLPLELVKATSACNTAEMCVQLADFLQKMQICHFA